VEREFELALKSLAPKSARIDPAAATREVGRRQARRRRRRWQAAAAAVVMLALLGAWQAIGLRGSRPQLVERPNRNDRQEPRRAVEPPTLLDYRWALMKSPSELDALLDRQATMLTSVSNNDWPGSSGASALWNVNLHVSLGEL
jgi:hypothetical protein